MLEFNHPKNFMLGNEHTKDKVQIDTKMLFFFSMHETPFWNFMVFKFIVIHLLNIEKYYEIYCVILSILIYFSASFECLEIVYINWCEKGQKTQKICINNFWAPFSLKFEVQQIFSLVYFGKTSKLANSAGENRSRHKRPRYFVDETHNKKMEKNMKSIDFDQM